MLLPWNDFAPIFILDIAPANFNAILADIPLIEAEFVNAIPPYDGDGTGNGTEAEAGWQKVVVEVGSRRLDISVPADPAPPGERPPWATS